MDTLEAGSGKAGRRNPIQIRSGRLKERSRVISRRTGMPGSWPLSSARITQSTDRPDVELFRLPNDEVTIVVVDFVDQVIGIHSRSGDGAGYLPPCQ